MSASRRHHHQSAQMVVQSVANHLVMVRNTIILRPPRINNNSNNPHRLLSLKLLQRDKRMTLQHHKNCRHQGHKAPPWYHQQMERVSFDNSKKKKQYFCTFLLLFQFSFFLYRFIPSSSWIDQCCNFSIVFGFALVFFPSSFVVVTCKFVALSKFKYNWPICLLNDYQLNNFIHKKLCDNNAIAVFSLSLSLDLIVN